MIESFSILDTGHADIISMRIARRDLNFVFGRTYFITNSTAKGVKSRDARVARMPKTDTDCFAKPWQSAPIFEMVGTGAADRSAGAATTWRSQAMTVIDVHTLSFLKT